MLTVPAVKTHLLPVMEEFQNGAASDPDAKQLDGSIANLRAIDERIADIRQRVWQTAEANDEASDDASGGGEDAPAPDTSH